MEPRRAQSRADCLELFEANREAMLDALARWGWEREDANGWTGKDHLAHVVAWQRRLLGWFAEDAAGRTPERPEPGYSFDQIDELNERDWQASRGVPLDEVRRDFEDAHAALVRLVQGMSDDDVTRPDRYAWLGFPALVSIAGNSFGHYLEHVEMLEAEAEG